MFAGSYFAPTYFAPTYWAGTGEGEVTGGSAIAGVAEGVATAVGVLRAIGRLVGAIAGVASTTADLYDVSPWWNITDFSAERHPRFVAEEWRRLSLSIGDIITTARHIRTGVVARLPTAWWY